MIEMFMEGDRPIIFLSQIIQSKKFFSKFYS